MTAKRNRAPHGKTAITTLTSKQEAFAQTIVSGMTQADTSANSGFVLTETLPKLGFYTYVLIDPQTDEIFYLGKGKGNRMYQHAKTPYAGGGGGVKGERIRAIKAAGLNVIERVFSCEPSEISALQTERMLICKLRGHGLTNKVNGVVTADECALSDAIGLLARFKSFDQWLSGASLNHLICAVRSCGTPKAFYQKAIQEASDLVIHLARNVLKKSQGVA